MFLAAKLRSSGDPCESPAWVSQAPDHLGCIPLEISELQMGNRRTGKGVSNQHSENHLFLCPELDLPYTEGEWIRESFSASVSNQNFGCGLALLPPLCLDFPQAPGALAASVASPVRSFPS